MKTIVGRIVLIIAFPNIAKLLPSICARRESCSKQWPTQTPANIQDRALCNYCLRCFVFAVCWSLE